MHDLLAVFLDHITVNTAPVSPHTTSSTILQWSIPLPRPSRLAGPDILSLSINTNISSLWPPYCISALKFCILDRLLGYTLARHLVMLLSFYTFYGFQYCYRTCFSTSTLYSLFVISCKATKPKNCHNDCSLCMQICPIE